MWNNIVGRYKTKRKYGSVFYSFRTVINANACFCTKSQKNRNGSICILCHKFWTHQNLDTLSTSKWPSEPQFCEKWTYIWPEMVVEQSFMNLFYLETIYYIVSSICYGSTSCGVFQAGGTKLEMFLLKINVPKGNYWILIIGVMGRCQKLGNLEYKVI